MPPRMPRCTAGSIGGRPSCGPGRRQQPQSARRRRLSAAHQAERIDVAAPQPGRPVQGRDPVVDAAGAEHRPGGHDPTGGHRDGVQVGVGGAQLAAVVDGDRAATGHRAGKRHSAQSGDPDRRPHRRGQVDAPMPRVAALRGEGAGHRPGDGRRQATARRRQRGGEQHDADQHGHGQPRDGSRTTGGEGIAWVRRELVPRVTSHVQNFAGPRRPWPRPPPQRISRCAFVVPPCQKRRCLGEISTTS